MALVYSTDKGTLCPGCGQEKHPGKCAAPSIKGSGKVRISRETKGRKGAGVTLISGIPLAEKELKELHRQLKQLCGVGGSIKESVLELQGDQRDKVFNALKDKPWDVKKAGG